MREHLGCNFVIVSSIECRSSRVSSFGQYSCTLLSSKSLSRLPHHEIFSHWRIAGTVFCGLIFQLEVIPKITIATQLSVDRLDRLQLLCGDYAGLISAAIYIKCTALVFF
eukprot:TRINITY_DN8470_c0_g1_i1.p1 TRINITY_DN8470_c0_g1~~TRINITY_DN8470_c0_g1_i1.p1  ORF type:complete len:110 (+),score=0.24 TRINITY_DN8470_c0_g1_i1:149-478(+)